MMPEQEGHNQIKKGQAGEARARYNTGWSTSTNSYPEYTSQQLSQQQPQPYPLGTRGD